MKTKWESREYIHMIEHVKQHGWIVYFSEYEGPRNDVMYVCKAKKGNSTRGGWGMDKDEACRGMYQQWRGE